MDTIKLQKNTEFAKRVLFVASAVTSEKDHKHTEALRYINICNHNGVDYAVATNGNQMHWVMMDSREYMDVFDGETGLFAIETTKTSVFLTKVECLSAYPDWQAIALTPNMLHERINEGTFVYLRSEERGKLSALLGYTAEGGMPVSYISGDLLQTIEKALPKEAWEVVSLEGCNCPVKLRSESGCFAVIMPKTAK